MIENKSISVIGAGSWGTALSIHFSKLGYKVNLWMFESFLCEVIKKTRENSEYLPGYNLSELIIPQSSLQEAIENNNVIFLVVPTTYIRNITKEMAPHLRSSSIIINCSKGIETDTLCMVQDIFAQTLPSSCSFATLSGPTFATEIARGSPSAIVVASKSNNITDLIKSNFSSPSLKIFSSNDPIGVEIGGALKNVLAITAGISDGLELGSNARAAIITRGLVEITRIGTALGAKAETFSGLSGLGDLVLTCTGNLSRNRQFGIRIGRGEKPNDIKSNMKVAVEGILTLKSAYSLKSKLNIQASIIEETYKIVYESKPPKEALKDLMMAKTTSEFTGIKGM